MCRNAGGWIWTRDEGSVDVVTNVVDRGMTWRKLRRALLVVGLGILSMLLINGISGFILLTNATVDPLEHADAIIVLGGEHDGREDYGLGLAREGWARTVVMSNPYWDLDPVMKRVCRQADDVEVICLRPEPLTTRGEAAMMKRLADERSWHRVIVISWQYHLPRARLIFRQCFSDDPSATIMEAVPRRYQYSLLRWEFIYSYQWGGLAKAIAQGECV